MQPIYTLLPGLHGTPALFAPLIKALGDVKTECIEYPQDIPQSYEFLLNWLLIHIDWTKERILVAESFSGPLALGIAQARPQHIEAVTIAASFCASPTNPSLALLPLRPLMLVRPSKRAIRHFLIGDDATELEVATLQSIVRTIPSKVLSQRIRAVLSLEPNECPPVRDIPLQILQAQNDTMIPWEAQNQLRMQYEHATTHWLDAPHLILQTKPDECAQLIKKFQPHYA